MWVSSLAHGVRFTGLALQTVLLPAVVMLVVVLVALARARGMFLGVRGVLLDGLFIHLRERLERDLDILDQDVAARPREVLAHHHAHQLQLLRIGGHRVRRHDPTTFAQVVRDGELIVVVLVLGVQPEGHQRETLACSLRHDYESEPL